MRAKPGDGAASAAVSSAFRSPHRSSQTPCSARLSVEESPTRGMTSVGGSSSTRAGSSGGMTARREHLFNLVAAVAAASLLLGTVLPGMPRSTQAPLDPALAPGDFALVAVAHGAAPRVARIAQDAGATETSTLDAIDIVTARVSTPALAALRSDPAVRLIAADGGVSASSRRKNVDVRGENSVGVLAIDAEKAWRSSTGRGVTVALLDTGIANHPALSGSVVASVDFVNDGAKLLDPGGHGTHLA